MNFVNLTPFTTQVLDNNEDVISTVKPSGQVALAAGDPPQLLNVPDSQDETAYIVLPAVSEASDRGDLISVAIEDAQRSRRGNVQQHVCYWSGD